jgi:hypothetical protein
MATDDFLLETDMAPPLCCHTKISGRAGVERTFVRSRYAGKLRLDSGNMSVSLPIFRNPLASKRVSAELSWEKHDHWLIKAICA